MSCANLSVDVMYGLPGLDSQGGRVPSTRCSTGSPITSPRTGSRSTRAVSGAPPAVEGIPAEQEQIDQYWRLARAAAARGLEHYEISNYARPGFRSRHNQIYWRAAEYLAAGPGACGFVGSTRYANVKATPRYCETLETGALPIAPPSSSRRGRSSASA